MFDKVLETILETIDRRLKDGERNTFCLTLIKFCETINRAILVLYTLSTVLHVSLTKQ